MGEPGSTHDGLNIMDHSQVACGVTIVVTNSFQCETDNNNNNNINTSTTLYMQSLHTSCVRQPRSSSNHMISVLIFFFFSQRPNSTMQNPFTYYNHILCIYNSYLYRGHESPCCFLGIQLINRSFMTRHLYIQLPLLFTLFIT